MADWTCCTSFSCFYLLSSIFHLLDKWSLGKVLPLRFLGVGQM